MGGFGDLFGAIGEMIGGAIEAREGLEGLMSPGERTQYGSQTETYDRVLCGQKQELNVNDV